MNMERWDDPRLVRHAQSSGEPGMVLSIFCARYYDRCRRCACHYVGEVDAWDITQKTFLYLGEKISSLRAPHQVWPILNKAVRHKALDLLRYKRRHEPLDSAELDSLYLDRTEWEFSRILLGGDEDEIWKRLGACLTEREFRILVARVIKGTEISEIAAREGLADRSVRCNLHRARKKLCIPTFSCNILVT